MVKNLKNTSYYREAIHELNYAFGNYYLFDGYVVAEIHEGVVYNWEDNGRKAAEDILSLYDNDGSNLIYITNRINNYCVKPADWLHFFRNSYKLKGYGVITYSKASFKNVILEKLFVRSKIVRFTSLEDAIFWAKNLYHEKALAS
ncbi:hypothetical protein HYG79_09275 [Costertonia aggregata]|uniref:STAS/SEC14 domain-containing protein n=1 Tax=Costertonia aggregata TaxID=343403 RepID=A0A7H9AUX1_9FLAO|nr:hypothetical protein HYG79_09275 [Costertonia aggregata]